MPTSGRSYSDHPLSSRAAGRMYGFVSWGTAVAVALAFTILINLLAATGKQHETASLLADLQTNIPAFFQKWGQSQTPGSLGFDLYTAVLATLFVRLIIAIIPPVRAPLQRYAEILAAPPFDVLSHRVIGRSYLTPQSGDRFFEEREDELAALLALARDDQPYRVTTVHGPSGIGKTRLALAWIAALRREARRCLPHKRAGWRRFLHPVAWFARRWDAGLLDQAGISSLSVQDLRDWRPLRPAAIVLDATEMQNDKWREIEDGLAHRSDTYLFPVRVLVLAYEAQAFATEYNGRMAQKSNETSIAPRPLSGQAVKMILSYALPGRPIAEQTTDALLAITGGLPFLVRMMAEDPSPFHAVRKGDLQPFSTPSDVLNHYADRLIAGCNGAVFGTEHGVALRADHALAVATLARALKTQPFDNFVSKGLPNTLSQQLHGETLLGLDPPLLALAYLFRISEATNDTTRHAIAKRAWHEAPDGVATMIRHFWLSAARDHKLAESPVTALTKGLPDPAWFQTYDSLPADAGEAANIAWFSAMLDVLRSSRLGPEDRVTIQARIAPLVANMHQNTAPTDILKAWAEFLASLADDGDITAWLELDALRNASDATRSGVVTGPWERADPTIAYAYASTDPAAALALADRLLSQSEEAATSREVALIRARTAVALPVLSPDVAPDALERAIAIFTGMDPAVRARTEIAAQECALSVNVAYRYQNAHRWDDMVTWLNRLTGVTERFHDNQHIQNFLATGAVNAVAHYGSAQRWNDMAVWLDTLTDVADRFRDNQDIQLQLARGAVNAALLYGTAQRWDDMVVWLNTLTGVAERFDDNQDIQRLLARGARDAVNDYGSEQRWDDMAVWLNTLTDVAERFGDNQDIQRQLAEGTVNATAHFGRAQRWDDMAACLNTLTGVAERFHDNQDIQRLLAGGALDAANHFGTAQRWDDMAAWLNTLIGVAERFGDNQDIQRQLAEGTVNATAHYGRAQRSDDMAACLNTLTGVAERFHDNQDIQRLLAGGAVNAVSHYGTAQQWDDMAAWLNTLTGVAERFHDNQDIQLRLAMTAVSAVSHYGTAQRWDDMAAWLNTLTGVAERFHDNQDIQHKLATGAVNAVSDYGTAQRWDDMAAWLNTLTGVAERFRDNQDIQLRLARGAAEAVWRDSIPRPLRAWALDILAGVARRQLGHLQIQNVAQEFGLTASEQMTRAMEALRQTPPPSVQRPPPLA
jgi:hypothetical protein